MANPKQPPTDNDVNLEDDQAALLVRYQEVVAQSQQLIETFWSRQTDSSDSKPTDLDPLGIGQVWADQLAALSTKPEAVVDAQLRWWTDSIELWHATAVKMLNNSADQNCTTRQSTTDDAGKAPDNDAAVTDVIREAPNDKRFKNDAWTEQVAFSFAKQAYLLLARHLTSLNTIASADQPDSMKRKSEFYTRQFADALSPSNFAFSNPQVVDQTIRTGGQNLLDGLSNLISDLDNGIAQGQLNPKIRQVDETAFSLGENIATTAGAVVFENDLMQLIQFAPTTPKVHRKPLLIVPPWINKYYILDLRPDNSLVRWLVNQGHTVFVISWVNPDQSLANKDFADYMTEGPLTALDAIADAFDNKKVRVNAVGYCIGGTLLAATLAYMQAKKDRRIASATLLTALIDFQDPGELGVFTGEREIRFIEEQMRERGYLDGASMANAFNLLRSSDLIWSFVINNYLLGKDPLKFDLLYWNSDSTRMPSKMHSFYLRNMYNQNRLRTPGAITLNDVPIDISSINIPAFFVATRDDHIAPWRSCFQGAKLFSGPVDFLLAGSGHIAGVVNPPDANKYGYWTGSAIDDNSECEQWFDDSIQGAGSWWPSWATWLKTHAGAKVAARQPGDGKLSVIEKSPGRYCRTR